MMRQYQEAKTACPDALLLCRMGDFYELFFDDARTAARLLGLALTSRVKSENAIPMAGFPHHQLESYLRKLVSLGMRVAICEQMEDPRQAKGLVKRDITRVVTPGTLTDDALLDPRESNYLAAVVLSSENDDSAGVAWVELSTGRFHAAEFPRLQLPDQLARIGPAECLIDEQAETGFLGKLLVTKRPAWAFSLATATQTLSKHFGTATLEGFGFDEDRDAPALRAAGAVLDYLTETQKSSLAHLDRLLPYHTGSTLEIDESTRRSLEISQTLRESRREGSLLSILDRTQTAMGSRLLADWVANPLAELAAIDERLDAVAELVADSRTCDDLRDKLRGIYDMQRLLARIATGRASPRNLAHVGHTLAALPAVKAKITGRKSELLSRLEGELDLCPEIRARLESALVEDCPLQSREGGIIRPGHSSELDGLRELAAGGKQWIARYQSEEAARSGIPTLKVGFNKVFGYYIEVTHTHGHKIPENYIRKQTVKNAERYITPELKEYEEKVLTADERSKELEYQLFIELREFVAAQVRRLQATAAGLAQLDVLAALADLARAKLLPAQIDRRADAGDPRRPPSGARCDHDRRLVRAQRLRRRARRGTDSAHHRSKHGRQKHLHPPGGAAHLDGANRQLRSRA